MKRAVRGLLVASLGSLAGAPHPAVARASGHRPVPVLCYVETLYGGVPASALDLAACTHLIEAFLIPDVAGALRPTNGLPREVLLRAARERGCRVLVAVGGATVPGATFVALLAHAEARARFLSELVHFVLEAGYDGVDLDWEFPGAPERELHARLVRDLRSRLEAAFASGRPGVKPLVLVGVTTGAFLEGYDFPALAKAADYLVQFGYDFRNPALGPWAHTAKLWPDGSDRPIEASVRGVASELVRRGVPRAQVIIGFPMYASDGQPWISVRERTLRLAPPTHPLYLENELDGIWVTGPAALEAKVRKAIAGSEVEGGAVGGIALWQLGHQGRFTDLTDALRRALDAVPPKSPR